MPDESTPTTPPAAATPKVEPPKATPKAPANEPLGEGGVNALEAERTARRQAEAELATLRKDFDGFQSKLS